MASQDLNKILFDHTRKGEWDEVVKIYKQDPEKASMAQITKMKDTSLHMAVSAGKTDIALQILDAIQNMEKVEEIVNEQGNTPLHLAAMQGDTRVCQKVKDMKNHKITTVRNKKGESAIFLAARHHKERAFIILHSMLGQDESLLRRFDGDTVFHVALANEYFRMAMRILKMHPSLADSINVNGVTPLHILAEKPNSFRSTTPLGYFDSLLYYCLVVDIELEDVETNKVKDISIEEITKGLVVEIELEDVETNKVQNINIEEITKGYPGNYQKCVFFVVNLFNFLMYCIYKRSKKNDKESDVENPNKKSDAKQSTGSDASSSTTNSAAEPKQKTATDQGSDIVTKKIKKESYPSIYASWVLLFKSVVKTLLIVLGIGIWRIKEIKKKKEIHKRAKVIMNELVNNNMTYAAGAKPRDEHYDPNFSDGLPNPTDTTSSDGSPIPPKKTICSPILIAAKTGATEMVEKILKEFPVAIYDLDEEQKNVVLLAIENRQPQVYQFLLNVKDIPKEIIFGHVDVNGNSALHLAATQSNDQRPWLIPGSALQMQWEIKWYEFVKTSMPQDFFAQNNNQHKTPKTIFLDSHRDLIKDGSEWLGKTSESCSVVAALVATVAFATSATVPGGVYQDKGTPTLGDKPEFNAFAIASLAALCFSVTALVFFLSILTSRYQEKDFAQDLPRKLLLGLTSLFSSIVCMLVSFCAGHVFILKYELRYVAYPLYAALCFPITFFAVAQVSLYFDLVMAIFRKVPQRSYEAFPR